MDPAAVAVLMAVIAIAYSNGANDDFKGVATLYGSGTVDYRTALLWAVATTLAGSLVAALFAEKLITVFSGAGLVPDEILADPAFIVAVAGGAAVTVFATAVTGIPISTTHSLTGALLGAGLMAAGPALDPAVLGQSFFLPLAVSPLLAVGLVAALLPVLRLAVRRMGLREDGCICITTHPTRQAVGGVGTLAVTESVTLTAGTVVDCEPIVMTPARLWRIDIARLLRGMHFLSAGAVSFARGTNDTPKIVGIALLAGAFELHLSVIAIALAMAAGGLLHSRRIARTLSRRILSFNEAEGTLANVVTSVLVIFASRLGLPVSTTHVTVSALFGLGAAKGNAHWSVVAGIILSWVLTLPAAMGAAAVIYWWAA